ncbi:hypothetical protein ATERTT37_004823 [Aspergillus terreus]
MHKTQTLEFPPAVKPKVKDKCEEARNLLEEFANLLKIYDYQVDPDNCYEHLETLTTNRYLSALVSHLVPMTRLAQAWYLLSDCMKARYLFKILDDEGVFRELTAAYNLAEIMELNQCPSKGWVGSDCRLALDRNEVNIYQTN